jgi:hypothetical protein
MSRPVDLGWTWPGGKQNCGTHKPPPHTHMHTHTLPTTRAACRSARRVRGRAEEEQTAAGVRASTHADVRPAAAPRSPDQTSWFLALGRGVLAGRGPLHVNQQSRQSKGHGHFTRGHARGLTGTRGSTAPDRETAHRATVTANSRCTRVHAGMPTARRTVSPISNRRNSEMVSAACCGVNAVCRRLNVRSPSDGAPARS